MARTARARIFRSTRTAPNVSPAADLASTFGTAANATTVAGFTGVGGPTGIQWRPGLSGVTANPPANPATAVTGNAWRDTTAEHAAEQVRYAAGTWTVRCRLTKTGQTVAADITVRVTVIVFRVTSAGAFVAELGRIVYPDTTLSTTTLTLTGSFTAVATTFNADDKIQVETYVETITANIPTAPAAAVNVNFIVDETSANSGAGFTAQPAYDILYARSFNTSGVGTATMARLLSIKRTLTTSSVGTVARRLTVTPLPKTASAVGTTARRLSIAPIPKTATALGTPAVRKSVAPIPKTATAIGTAAMARTVTAARSFTTSAIGVATYARALVFGRQFNTTATGLASGRVDMPITALNRIIPAPAADWPLNTPTKVIAGVTRNSTGGIVGGAAVKLVRQSDDVRVASTTSHATTGAYSFTRGGDDPNTYRVVATKAGTPEIHGITDVLIPA